MNEKKLEALKKSNIAEIKKAVKNLDEDSSQDTKIRRKSKVVRLRMPKISDYR